MTQQEFFQRTGVQLSSDEYWTINEQYNESSLNKDEYCKLWMKLNPKRVEEAKMAQKKANDADFLYGILMFNIGSNWYDKSEDQMMKYTKASERKKLADIGIEITSERGVNLTVRAARNRILQKLEELR